MTEYNTDKTYVYSSKSNTIRKTSAQKNDFNEIFYEVTITASPRDRMDSLNEPEEDLQCKERLWISEQTLIIPDDNQLVVLKSTSLHKFST